tara:strand:- start:237 stop:371 length:135 start_codon:yes stop_codon:yes gene_type:complete
MQYQKDKTGAVNDLEAAFFEQCGPLADDTDFFLELLRQWDKDFR